MEINDAWNGIEVEYYAADLTGVVSLFVNGVLKETLAGLDTDALTIDSVRLGAVGVEAGTSGTLYFDDYESRRLSRIGLLSDPGMDETTPTPVAGWTNKSYSYDDDAHKHAVTELVVTDTLNNQTTNTYRYDDNGNMTCRRENSITYLQAYNAENRISGVVVYAGDCDTLGEAISQSWIFTYDGDGNKVKQEYTNGTSTLTTYYYAGGTYEVQTDGITETVRQYYAIGGVSVGMTINGEMSYFLTDHLGSIVVVTDDTGVITSETRYLPFGEVRSDVGTISETNYGYTNQEVVPDLGLMDYNARFYDSYLNRWTQPDSIVAEAGSTQGLNRYSYSNNNPINFTDPSGHFAWGVAIKIVVAVAIVATVAVTAYVASDILNTSAITSPRAPVPTNNNVTSWFVDRLNENANSVVTVDMQQDWNSPNLSAKVNALKTWVSMVKGGAVWDYKSDMTSSGIIEHGESSVQLGGIDTNFQTVANINYGAMASRIGMPQWFAEFSAGAYQVYSHFPRFKGNVGGPATDFDDPADNYWIKFGYWFEENYGDQFGSITSDLFTSALNEYIKNNGKAPEPLSPGYVAA